MKPVSLIICAATVASLLSLTGRPVHAQSGSGTVQIGSVNNASPLIGITGLTGSPTSPPTGSWMGGTNQSAGSAVNASSGPSSSAWGGPVLAVLSNDTSQEIELSVYPNFVLSATATGTTGSGHPYGESVITITNSNGIEGPVAVWADGTGYGGTPVTHYFATKKVPAYGFIAETGSWGTYADLNYH